MLTELRVFNLALIANASLEFGPGLTVLSGETGAGKTALLSSLKLLIGERADSAMVGSVGSEARVEAAFEIAGTDGIQQEHLIVRRVTQEGRSRCYFDDSLVTVTKLGEELGPLVDLYGQHEHQSLLSATEQLKYLDSYAGEEALRALRAYQESLDAYKEAADALQGLQELCVNSGAEREQAAFVLREIEKVAPQPGEYEALEQELPLLQNGEQFAAASVAALDYLRGEGGALEKLNSAAKSLESLRGIDKILDASLEHITSLAIDLEEAAGDVGRYASGIEYDPQKLQEALDRLGELDGLSRRFGPGMQQVFALAERSEQLLKLTVDSEATVKEAEENLKTAKKSLETAASTLAVVRAAAVKGFEGELNSSIAHLALAGASLEFSIQELPFERWSSKGSQSFELLYKPAPAVTPRPLAKIASGGELSRVMLAIKSLLSANDASMTLVFDEIDAGIGGKTASAVAERLASLAKHNQVIVITHLAQIAAKAESHFLVSKTSTQENTHTTIAPLTSEERVIEIARMLSGSSDKEALAHAEKLLKEACQ